MDIELQKGSIVICAIAGDYGKPRPAIIVQSGLFSMHASFTVCPITSHLVKAPLFRLLISPDADNGLKVVSQIMIDKIMTIHKDKIHQKIGYISKEQLKEINQALKYWLSLDDKLWENQ